MGHPHGLARDVLMTTNKQKKALKYRRKLANRQPTKAEQIKRLQKKLAEYEDLPVNAFTGERVVAKIDDRAT